MAKYFLISLFLIAEIAQCQCPAIRCCPDTLILNEYSEECVTVNYPLPQVMDLCYDTGRITYHYTGKARHFTVPEGVKEVTITMFSATNSTSKKRENYVTCNLKVVSGQKIILFVGGDRTFAYPYSYISLINEISPKNEGMYKKVIQQKKVTNKKLVSSISGEQGVLYLSTDKDFMLNETQLVSNLEFHESTAIGDGKITISWSNASTLKTTLLSGLGSGACFPTGSHKETYTVESSAGMIDTSSFYVNVLTPSMTNEQVYIYPNPTSGFFTIDLKNKNKEPINFVLSTIDGVMVKSGVINDNKVVVNLTHEKKGVYTLQINDHNQMATYKVIKQ